MSNQICPHCEQEITEEDVKEYQAYLEECDLYDKFCETERYKSIKKTNDRLFNGGMITILSFLIIGPFFKFITVNDMIINFMGPGMLVGLIMLIIWYFGLESRGKRAFEEFKKSRAA